MRALTEDGGFSVPEGVTRIPGTNVPRDKKYDQIAFRSAGGFFQATGAAGAFDFYNHVFTGDDADTYRQYIDAYISARAAAGHRSPKPPTSASGALTQFKMWRTYQMSDHLPLWAEFRSTSPTTTSLRRSAGHRLREAAGAPAARRSAR